MSAALHLAGTGDLDRLLPMVAAFHALEGVASDEAHIRAGLVPLLEGIPHGAVYLIGPRKAPVGYIIISFGWSLDMGGLDGFIDEFFIRDSVRGRGMGSEVLVALLPALSEAGVRALHLEVGAENDTAKRLYQKLGFTLRDGYHLMTWRA